MNKASGSNGMPDELFQILKDNAMQVLHSVCQQIWKTQQRPQFSFTVFISFHSNPKEKQCQRMLKLAFLSHASKLMLKILEARLHSTAREP